MKGGVTQMGLLSDAGDYFQKMFKDLFAAGIKDQFDGISQMLNNTFDSTTNSTGLVSRYITEHPANFTGTTSSTGTTIWSTIEKLCTDVVVPIGGFVLVIILLSDLIQTVIRGNNFKEFDDSIFIKWIIKSVCGILLVSNVYYIASAIFSFGTDVSANGVTYLFGADAHFLGQTVSLSESTISQMSLAKLVSVWFFSLITHLAVMLLIIAIVIILASRIIEIFMYLGISPIPMATMLNNDWGEIGKNWIRSLLALSFQGFFIVIALGIFKTLFSNAIVQLNRGGNDLVMQMALLMGYAAALVFTVMRSGSISKSIFNAH